MEVALTEVRLREERADGDAVAGVEFEQQAQRPLVGDRRQELPERRRDRTRGGDQRRLPLDGLQVGVREVPALSRLGVLSSSRTVRIPALRSCAC